MEEEIIRFIHALKQEIISLNKFHSKINLQFYFNNTILLVFRRLLAGFKMDLFRASGNHRFKSCPLKRLRQCEYVGAHSGGYFIVAGFIQPIYGPGGHGICVALLLVCAPPSGPGIFQTR